MRNSEPRASLLSHGRAAVPYQVLTFTGSHIVLVNTTTVLWAGVLPVAATGNTSALPGAAPPPTRQKGNRFPRRNDGPLSTRAAAFVAISD